MTPNVYTHPSPKPFHPWAQTLSYTHPHTLLPMAQTQTPIPNPFHPWPPILTHTHPLNPFTHGPKHSHTPIPTPPSHDTSSLLVMFCDSSKWFVLLCHGSWCFVMVRGGSSWFVMFRGSLSWFVMVCDLLWWFVMVRHGSSWFTVMVRHGSSWFTVMVCHGSSWFTVMVPHGSSWFTVMVRHGSLSWFHHGSSWFVMCYSLKFSRKGHVTLYLANQGLKFTIKSHFWWDFLFSPFHLKSIPLKSSAQNGLYIAVNISVNSCTYFRRWADSTELLF